MGELKVKLDESREDKELFPQFDILFLISIFVWTKNEENEEIIETVFTGRLEQKN